MEKMPVKRGMKCKRYVVMSDECGRKYIEKIDTNTKQKKKVYLDEIEKLKKCCVKNSFQEDVVESRDSEEESLSPCEKNHGKNIPRNNPNLTRSNLHHLILVRDTLQLNTK